MTVRGRRSPRVVPVCIAGLLCLLAGGLALILAAGSSAYSVQIDFADAGQLLPGDLVEVGGIPVGSVTALNLTRDDQAQVSISLNFDTFTPLHQGTKASIGTVGLSGVTNRFVALSPGPQNAPPIRPGGLIPQTDTTGIVDIDEVLDTITPPVRESLRRWIQESAGVLHGSIGGARQTLKYAAAAIERSGDFIGQVTEDSAAFNGLLASGAKTAAAISSQRHALSSAIDNTSSALGAIAAARASLTNALSRAPTVLDQGTALANQLRPTLVALDPVLRDARPVAAPLAAVLRALVPTARAGTPLLLQLNAILPSVDLALKQLLALRHAVVPALRETTTALIKSFPIFTGIRPYAEDILLGTLYGYGGGSSENYDANGQFSRIALGLPSATLLTSFLGFNLPVLSPHFLLGQTDKCPGSAAQPAADGSNHVVVPDCNPSEVP